MIRMKQVDTLVTRMYEYRKVYASVSIFHKMEDNDIRVYVTVKTVTYKKLADLFFTNEAYAMAAVLHMYNGLEELPEDTSLEEVSKKAQYLLDEYAHKHDPKYKDYK